MFYTVYKITNTINDKIYIGVHKTDNMDDDYMGSGVVLTRAQEKYGIENFSKEIIQVFDNSEDMFNMESTLVNEEFVERVDTYNIKLGGQGGFDYINLNGMNNNGSNRYTEERNKKISNSVKQQYKLGKRISIFTEMHKQGKIKYDTFTGKKHSKETKKKISDKLKITSKGENNSQFGSMWIYSLEEKVSKKIPKGDIPEGWLKGRKMKF